jgi:hypothetical protein
MLTGILHHPPGWSGAARDHFKRAALLVMGK